MIEKRLLRPERLRRIPESFSWLDHRLIRDRRLAPVEPSAAALYLFLVCVGDAEGLSYHGDKSIGRHLNLEPLTLERARRQLVDADLIAYRKPLYQVLDLEDSPGGDRRTGRALSLKELFERAMKQEGGER